MAFRRLYPHIDIRLAIGNTSEVVRGVHDGTAEIGFVEGAIDDPELVSATVAHDQLVLVVSPSHPWAKRAGRTKLLPAELLDAEWILREPGSGTRSEFETVLERLGVPPHDLHVAMELPSNEAVRAAVESGMGATVFSASVAAPGLEAERLHRVPLDLPARGFQLVHHRERYLSRSAVALLALVGLS